MFLPGREHSFPDSRFCDVIDNEDLIGMAIDKFNRLRKMPFEDQDVVNETELLNFIDSRIEIAMQNKIGIGFIVNDVPQALQHAAFEKASDLLFQTWFEERRPAYNTLDEIVLLGQLKQPFCLARRLTRLHGNRTVYAGGSDLSQ